LSTERQQQILDIAREKGRVAVDDLVQRFGVTPQSIRKDLTRLCDGRLLTRTHGGALLASATASVVVPILTNREALSGMRSATARPIARLLSLASMRLAS